MELIKVIQQHRSYCFCGERMCQCNEMTILEKSIHSNQYGIYTMILKILPRNPL
jgi:hypothetical protein